jgi:predicted Ser/Thr protein kinase
MSEANQPGPSEANHPGPSEAIPNDPTPAADATACPRCGVRLAPGGRAEDCPRCLLAAGLESAAADGGPPPARTAPAPEEIGRHFPQLEVLELLGQGGMGIVYKARQRSLDRLVALKVMPPDAARETGFVERFTREARTLARLQHANIVQIHDFGTSDGLCWLLMEYVDGANLREAMRGGGLTPAQALAIVPQVCDALQYAHEQGVVHRDIKPENILIDRAGRVRIADFGLAKIVQRTPVDVTLTRAGQVMGTLHYMAPEQYRTPDSVDHRADIYSLGVVFYEMLTGELPIGSFPPPSERAGVDARLDGVVLRALERERDRRWQHASDVKTSMSDIAKGPAAAASPPVPPPLPAEPPPGTKVVNVGGIHVTKGPAGTTVDIPAGIAGTGNVHVHRPGGDGPRRTSPLAVAGGLAVPAVLLLGGVLAMADLGGLGVAAVLIGLGLAGFIASIVAYRQIGKPDSGLTGRGWAVAGMLLAPAYLCCGLPALAFSGVPMGLSVSEGPDGTRVRMPFLEVHERSDGSTSVKMPGLHVEEDAKGNATVRSGERASEELGYGPGRVRVPDAGGTDEDDAAAELVTGGPATLTRKGRAGFVAAMRALWNADGPRVVEHVAKSLPTFRAQEHPANGFEMVHLVLADDGRSGRMVLTDRRHTLAVAVREFEGGWALQTDAYQHHDSAPLAGDRDGNLGD